VEKNKLYFDVDDVKLVEENPDSSFATLSIDFFASGKNRHDMYVSEDTLMRTASTIKNCPLVWKYDSRLNDVYTHDPDEVPCGFVPETAEIKSRLLADGRTMLSVVAYVWKKYSGEILKFFKRDGDKPVSVEMSVFETKPYNDLEEIVDYKFEAITILGSFVTPAIPLAKAKVIQFAEEYKDIVELEFGRYEELNFKIPNIVKNNAKEGLLLNKEHNKGGTGIGLAIARYLAKNEGISPERVRNIAKYFQRHTEDYSSDKTSDGWIAWQLRGGNAGRTWSIKLTKQIDEINNRQMAYFDKSSVSVNMTENNPIKEELSVADEEKVEEMSGQEDQEKMADKSKEEEKETEVSEKEKMAAEPEKTEEKPEEEEKEEKPEDKEEKEKEEEMSLDSYLDVAALLAMLTNETEGNEKLVGEFAKPFAQINYGKAMGFMFSKMQKMAEEIKERETKMSSAELEMESLKQFKVEKENEKFNFAVNVLLKEIEEKVQIPASKIEELREKAKEYSIDNLDAWCNFAKASALDFAIKDTKEGFSRYGFPVTTEIKKSNSLWHREN